MDLSPFKKIHPCGITNLVMTQMNNLAKGININDVIPILIKTCKKKFSIDKIKYKIYHNNF